MQYAISILLSGVSLGGQYALIAIGYTMVYGILRLINFAHGDVFMAAGLMILSRPLVSFLYGDGEFDAFSIQITSQGLFWVSLGMAGYAVQNILSRAYFARQKGKIPLLAGGASILVNPDVLRHSAEARNKTAEHPRGETPPLQATDAATDMMRKVSARKEVDLLNSLLRRDGVLPKGDKPDEEKHYRDLLRSLDPVSRRKM